MGRIAKTALLGGLIAGALDIIYICIHVYAVYGAPPTRVWQSVAAGVLGRDAAIAGGLPTALLGLALHFFIAIVMAAVFVIAASRVAALTRFAWIAGPLYGLVLYAAMQYVVLPLSAAGGGNPPEGQFFWGALAAHTLLVGLPIALVARRFAPQSA